MHSLNAIQCVRWKNFWKDDVCISPIHEWLFTQEPFKWKVEFEYLRFGKYNKGIELNGMIINKVTAEFRAHLYDEREFSAETKIVDSSVSFKIHITEYGDWFDSDNFGFIVLIWVWYY